jgi:hypothetical protein
MDEAIIRGIAKDQLALTVSHLPIQKTSE